MPAVSKPLPKKVLEWERMIAAGKVTRDDAVKVLEKHEPKLAQQLREAGEG